LSFIYLIIIAKILTDLKNEQTEIIQQKNEDILLAIINSHEKNLVLHSSKNHSLPIIKISAP